MRAAGVPRISRRIEPLRFTRSSTGSCSRVAEPLRIAVFVDQFPELSETFIAAELQMLRTLGHHVTVESIARAPKPNEAAASGLEAHYLDDDSRADRLRATAWLALRHPLRCLRDLL